MFVKWGGEGHKSRTVMEEWCSKIWGEVLEVKALENSWFLLKFPDQKWMTKALETGPYFLDSGQLHPIEWQPNFDPRKTWTEESAVWLRLCNLPSEY